MRIEMKKGVSFIKGGGMPSDENTIQ